MWRIFPLAVVVCLVCLFSANAQTVNESETSIVFNEKTAVVNLTIENAESNKTQKVSLEILDETGIVKTQISTNQLFKQGKNSYQFNLQLGDLLEKNQADIFWYRLRYQVGDKKGILSLSQIMKDIFELQVFASNNILAGMTFRQRVKAFNPFTFVPLAKVKIDGELELEIKNSETPITLKSSGETDQDGFVTFEFQIPIDANLDDGEIKFTGKRNGIIRELKTDLRTLSDDFQFLLMTDKPLYQPEQTLNVRGVLLKGGEGKVIVPDAEVEFRIEDEDDTVVHQIKTKTSEFGVASISWQIPENIKLGNYRIRVNMISEDESHHIANQIIKISRYDLPNFIVTGKALKPYYLPNENEAEIEVNADYLFGKPVTNGRVRIVRETERSWNYKKQKYEIEEGENHSGKIDKEGKFKAKFNLKEDHAGLKDDSYRKFEDLNFTAYFTDLTTNKTEQRRFDVRISKEPIHVYFLKKERNHHANLPVNAYASAFYADGTPCLCNIELKGQEEYTKEKYQTILKTNTNSTGAAKLTFMRPKFDSLWNDLDVEIIAQDKNGLKGTFGGEDYSRYDDDLQFDDEITLEIETDKTIYKPGESFNIKLNAAFDEDAENTSPRVFIDIVKGWSVIDSYFVNLKNGKGNIKIPYQPKFQGELTISAYFEDEDEDLVKTNRGIIFPFSESLKVNTEFDKESYKPGENAKANFSILDSIGQKIESVLGIVIFDKAVEERAKTNDGNNIFSNGYADFLGYGKNFGGINIKNINDLDLSNPISDEYQLAAEIMLRNNHFSPDVSRSQITKTAPSSVYAAHFRKQFEPIEKKLAEHFKSRQFDHPTDAESFARILKENSINFADLKDPWEQGYRAVFSIEKTNNIVRIISAGPDKKFDTNDDFSVSSASFAYFIPIANRLNQVLDDYPEKHNNQFIRDEKTLFQELDITELKDRWGNPYQISFGVEGKYFTTRIRSLGADGKVSWYDDFDIFDKRQDYFKKIEERINRILFEAEKYPRNEESLKSLLKTKGTDLEQTTDGWGEKIYIFKREFSRYSNITKEENVIEFGKEGVTKKTTVTPVTQGLISFQLRSKGADKKENTNDDFTLAEFAKVVWEQTKDDPQPIYKNIAFTNRTGGIQGTITDASGAVIPNITVTATNSETSQSFNATTNENGKYLIGNLALGTYNVRVSAAGFKDTVVQGVKVVSNGFIEVNLQLEIGDVNSVVEISGGAEVLNSTSASMVTVNGARSTTANIQIDGFDSARIPQRENIDDSSSPNSTPRLREYFPETLFWSPELITDKNGKASINFKMADNITTWKLYTIASTKNGKFGMAEKEILSFKSFFADLDPPKFLTETDEIHLPVQIRNYTKSKQKVDVTMAKSDWFSFLSPEKQNIEVGKDKSENAVFGFKALIPIKDGKQRVTAMATSDSDAIEKPITVRPNGEQIINTETKLFNGSEKFEVNFPDNALPKTAQAEVKIYPNLLAHVTESIEGLLQRPYGCGEQTISSTYPNLMILKYVKNNNSLSFKAQKYLQSGYERLLGYQVADGGFSYWGGNDESNLVLTAYALRFLSDAREFITVDEKVVERAEQYLIKQQRADGSWAKMYRWQTVEDQYQTKGFTTYIAKTLAGLGTDKDAVSKALAYLKKRNAEIDEPYNLALYALTNFEVKENSEAERIVNLLKNLGKTEGNSVYWNLEKNTPFFGWGNAGRIETTALVVQALLKSSDQDEKTKDLITKGMLFLLRNKDRYGVWYSTQTTINVLDTFIATLSDSKSQKISVFLNGEKIKELNVAADQIEQIVVDLNGKLSSNNNLEVKTSSGSTLMSQVVQNHYIDWKDSVSTKRDVNDSRAIQLDYSCDKPKAEIMETVTCSVKAERIGFQGYGMLLAEIGIPPGADVSRESLDKAFENDWSLSRYEVLPDRIVVYMWAKAGGSKFDFSFKPRYGIKAKTPASIIYDYYNEDSRGTVAPLNFEVK